MRVRVYRNLHTGTLSVQEKIAGKGWRVTGHRAAIALENVRFLVTEGRWANGKGYGRQKVLATGAKNVHAYVEGEVVTHLPMNWRDLPVAKYNPYKGASFTDRDSGEAITSASYAVVRTEGASYRA